MQVLEFGRFGETQRAQAGDQDEDGSLTGLRFSVLVGFVIISAGMTLMFLPPPGGFSAIVWLVIGSALAGLGMGLSVPASNNAGIQLAPDDIAAIAGMRGMFRQSGGIIGVSVTTAILARSADPGHAQAHVLLVFAVLMVLVLPLVLLVPDHRGRWQPDRPVGVSRQSPGHRTTMSIPSPTEPAGQIRKEIVDQSDDVRDPADDSDEANDPTETADTYPGAFPQGEPEATAAIQTYDLRDARRHGGGNG